MIQWNEHVLSGCRTVPLAHYLKSLGVLRLVAEQADPCARGFWRADTFVLRTNLDRPALERFFLHSYEPTPLIAPWNGGSGFYSEGSPSARKALGALSGSTAKRLEPYRAAITSGADCLRRLAIDEKVGKKDKPRLLELCRGVFPEAALMWLDAAVVLTGDDPAYPPLLGTGGNDGNLEFTINFMQRILELIELCEGGPRTATAGLLGNALFRTPSSGFSRAAVGQFFPSGAGGANAASSYDGRSIVNPWDTS